MQIRALGHVVIKVRDLERAAAFYNGMLGIPIMARAEQWRMIFFSLGRHHDFAVSAIGPDAESPAAGSVGLDHVAFALGDDRELRDAKAELEGRGIPVVAIDHGVTHSLYLSDPDGNAIELYVDASDAWRHDPAVMLGESRPLDL